MTMASIFRASLRGQHRPRSFPSRCQTRLSSSSSLQQAQQTAQNAFETASKHAGNAFEKLRKAAGPFGDRAANLLGSYREPLTYNLSVARELLKQIYIAERLQPPLSPQIWADAYATLVQRARSPAYWKGIISNGEWAQVAIYAVEAYAIFNIGEIIGRRHLVGYKLN